MELRVEDIENKFNELNQSFFGGSLEVNFPFRISSTLRALGHVSSTGSTINHLAISQDFEWTEAELEAVIFHEMIHVWQKQVYPKSKGHDVYFKRKARELSKLSGIDIPLTGRIKSTKIRRCKYLLIERKDKNEIVFCSDSNFSMFLEYWLGKSIKLKLNLITGDADITSRFQICRTLSKYYSIPKSSMEGIEFLSSNNEQDNPTRLEAIPRKQSYFLSYKRGGYRRIIFCSKKNYEEFRLTWRINAIESNSELNVGICEQPIGYKLSRKSSKAYRFSEKEFEDLVIIENLDQNKVVRKVLESELIQGEISLVKTDKGVFLAKGEIEDTLQSNSIISNISDLELKKEFSIEEYLENRSQESLYNLFPELDFYNLESRELRLNSKIIIIYSKGTSEISLILQSTGEIIKEMRASLDELALFKSNVIDENDYAA